MPQVKSAKRTSSLPKKVKKVKKTKKEEENSDDEVARLDGEGSLNGSDDEEEDETVGTGSMAKHKLDLEKLKQSDPEFFKFLQSEDADLLNLDDADDDENDDVDDEDVGDEELEEDEDENDDVKPVKKPKVRQDPASGRLVVDANVYNYLQEQLDVDTDKVDVAAVRMAIDVFVACVARVGADIEAPKYVINEQQIFEACIRLCFQTLPTAFNKLLEVKEGQTKIKLSKHAIKKYQNILKTYLQALIIFLSECQTADVITSTLKAISMLVDVYAHFAKMTKLLVKALTKVWSRKTLDSRIIAFVCMNKLVKNHPQHFPVLYKAAYVSFVNNAKVVTNESWPLLQFMHRTFAELSLQEPDQAYKFAFVYIRQTAVHLRNAMIGKGRKDLVFSVYNWQMMQCMYLWVRVIARAHSVSGAESIAELVYPLVQTIIGIFRLCNAPAFLPLRLHCCQLLVQLQASCTVYVPLLRIACDTLAELARELKKKPVLNKKIKVPDVECTIKVSTQYSDNPQWRKAVCEYMFRTMMQAAHLIASHAAFPDVMVPVVHTISQTLGDVKNGDFVQLFKGLLAKLKEHSKFVQTVLRAKDVKLNDEMQNLAVKFDLNNPDSPLRVYYRQWEKVWKMKQQALMKELAEAKKTEKTDKTTDKKTKKDEKNPRKRPVEEIEADVKEELEELKISKSAKKRAKIGAAAKKADASVPDRMADLADWSDNDE